MTASGRAASISAPSATASRTSATARPSIPDAPGSRAAMARPRYAPRAAVEATLTALLLAWALATGVLETPSLPGQIPLPLVGAAAAIAAGLLWLLARKAPRLLRDVRAGMTTLRHPRAMAVGVLPW